MKEGSLLLLKEWKKVVRKSVNNSVTGLKFRVKQIKYRENLVEPVVNINNMTLSKATLSLRKYIKRQDMQRGGTI